MMYVSIAPLDLPGVRIASRLAAVQPMPDKQTQPRCTDVICVCIVSVQFMLTGVMQQGWVCRACALTGLLQVLPAAAADSA